MSRDDKNKSPRAKRREDLKRRRRLAMPFFTLLFALAIVAFIIPLRPTESASEKRKLTEFPEFSVDTLLSGEYFDGIGLWFSDTFPFRDHWLAASARLGELHGLNDVVIYGEICEADELPPADETPAASAEPPPTPEPTPTPAPTPTPEVFTPEPQVLDIDFEALMANEGDSDILAVHEVVAQSEPSWTNEYTGMFRGKNLVWVCAASFATWALDEVHTPTLYAWAHSGFVFENFCFPITAASTTGGEFITLTGLMQNSSKQYMLASKGSYMPYAMGNVLNPLGYTSIAYHGGQYTYYSRNETLPNLGYEFRANTRGIELDEPWLLPTSDLDLVRNTVDDYIGREPFNIYIMSISGHMDYVFGGGHDICSRYKDAVQDLTGYTRPAQAYIASQMDLDLAVEYLIDSLDEAGIMDDKVLVIPHDH